MSWVRVHLLIVVGILALLTSIQAQDPVMELCGDGIDNDADGLAEEDCPPPESVQPESIAVYERVMWNAPPGCRVGGCTYDVAIDGALLTTTAEQEFVFPAPADPGVHVITVTTVSTTGRSAPSTIGFRTVGVAQRADCSYRPPGGVLESRPLGFTVQGTNAEAGQATRIAELRKAGWRIDWQWDPVTRRVFLMAECVGVPQ